MSNMKHQIDKRSLEQNDEPLRKFKWLRKNFAYCFILSATIWLAVLGYYIEYFIGWDSIIVLAPVDFSVFLLATVLPLLFVWFLLAYIERSSSLDANANLFATYIDSLLYPDDDATKNAKAISEALQKQASKLHQESRIVLEQSGVIKTDLENRVNELSEILKLLDEYSGKTLTDLNAGVSKLAERCTYITDKTTVSVNHIKDCSADISQSASNFLGKINPIIDEITAVSANVKNNIATNKTNLETIKNQLESCSDISQSHIDSMLAKTAENTRLIGKAFYKTAEECDALYKKMDTSISSIEGRVEEQKRLITTQTKVIDHNSELLNNKLTKYGQTLSAEIDKLVKNSVFLEKTTKQQISSLKAVSNETHKAISNINGSFDEKRAEIERQCEFAINSMQNVLIAVNKETDKLVAFTNLTQAKNYDLQNITETIVNKVGDMSSKLSLKTDTLKDKAVEVIDKFTNATDLITHGADKINTSSSLLINSSKEGLKLLEEQNSYITNTINNMTLLKEKLDSLRGDIKQSSEEITGLLSQYEKQIVNYNTVKSKKAVVDAPTQDFEREKFILVSQGILKTLQNLNIRPEKLYEGCDIFDLWDSYLEGRNNSFTDILSTRLTKRQTINIRKAFDDNTDFHNLVINYLFLMDVLIKELMNPTKETRNELLNFSTNNSLDKIYFILIKALNSAE